MKRLFLLVFLFFFFYRNAYCKCEISFKDLNGDGIKEVVLKNGIIEIGINKEGGQIISWKHKGKEFVRRKFEMIYGLASNHIAFERFFTGNFSLSKFYRLEKCGLSKDKRIMKVRFDAGPLKKIYIMEEKKPFIEIRFTFINETSKDKSFNYWMHNFTNFVEEERTKRAVFLLPMRQEILKIDYDIKDLTRKQCNFTAVAPGWKNDMLAVKKFFRKNLGILSDGWIAAIHLPTKRGFILTFNLDELAGFYNWQGGGTTFELIYKNIILKPGEKWETSVKIGSFENLDEKNVEEKADLLKKYKFPDVETVEVRKFLKPKGKVVYRKEEIEKVKEFFGKVNFTILYGEKTSPSEKRIIERLAKKTGQSITVAKPINWDSFYYKRGVCVIGTPQTNSLINNLSAIEDLISENYPGRNKGIIKFYENYSVTQAPLVFIGGYDKRGLLYALNFILREIPSKRKREKIFDVWVEDSMRKVFKYSRNIEERKKISLKVAKNEKESVYLVLTSYRDIERVEVEGTELKSLNGKDKLPGPECKVIASRKYSSMEWYDVILETNEISLKKDITQPFWISFSVPKNAKAGKYYGEIKIISRFKKEIIPVEITVWDFVLPDELPVPFYGWDQINVSNFAQFLGVNPDDEKEVEKIYDDWWEKVRQQGQNAIRIGYDFVDWIEKKDGYSFDYRRFDHYIEKARKKGFKYIFGALPFPNRPKSYAITEKGEKKRINFRSPKYRKVIENYLWIDDYIKHLKEKNLMNMVHCFLDEPNIPMWKEWGKPYWERGLKIFCAMNATYPEVLSVISDIMDTWILSDVGKDDWFDFAENLRKKGQRFWWYDCLGLFKLTKAHENTRSFFWDSYRYKVDGIAIYGTLCIYSNLYAINKNRKKEKLSYKDLNWNLITPYECVFYPDRKNHKLLRSVRGEIIRESIEDYKYLYILGNLVKDKEWFRNLLEEGSYYMNRKKCDYKILREKIAEQILKLREKEGDSI
ncbi:hypothetical protein J7L87_04805 [bacterium]|nr:hypothetical protein [bacterium]